MTPMKSARAPWSAQVRESLAGLLLGLLVAGLVSWSVWGLPGCGPAKEPPGPAPATCSAACAKLRSLDCDEGRPTPEGQPCELWCEHFGDHRAAALPYGVKTQCLASVASCPEVKACGR